MATDTATDAPVGLTDGQRWGGEVVAQKRFVYRYGTHEYLGELQVFDGGKGHVTLAAPTDPPPAAEAIVAAGLGSDTLAAHVALILADEWEIDTDELAADTDAPAETVEVTA